MTKALQTGIKSWDCLIQQFQNCMHLKTGLRIETAKKSETMSNHMTYVKSYTDTNYNNGGRFNTVLSVTEMAKGRLLLLLLSHFSCVRLCATPRQKSSRLPHPWDSLGKNTGVGCHFLLQCMKEKSEREVAQSCPTLSDPMDCSLSGSSVHGIFQAKYWSGVPLPSLKRKVSI